MKKNMLYIFVAPYPATYCRATISCVDITSGCVGRAAGSIALRPRGNKLQATCDTLRIAAGDWMYITKE